MQVGCVYNGISETVQSSQDSRNAPIHINATSKIKARVRLLNADQRDIKIRRYDDKENIDKQ